MFTGDPDVMGWSCPPKPLCNSPPSSTGERKWNERLMGWDNDRERSFTSYCHEQNSLDLEKKLNPTLLLFFGSPSSLFISTSALWVMQEDCGWELCSIYHMLTLLLPWPEWRTPHILLLLQCVMSMDGQLPMNLQTLQSSRLSCSLLFCNYLLH